jgi:hypothetical protein
MREEEVRKRKRRGYLGAVFSDPAKSPPVELLRLGRGVLISGVVWMIGTPLLGWLFGPSQFSRVLILGGWLAILALGLRFLYLFIWKKTD